MAPWQVQVALNIPPNPHRPGMHHLDGFPPEPDGRPGTFTMLAGVLMSDQRDPDAGNLWVWPGTHLTHAAYFREHGPDAFFAAGGYPPIPLPEPEQVTGEPGDLLLAHYLLGHNIGGNKPAVRRAVYYRIKRPATTPGGVSSSRTPGWTTTPSGISAGIQHPADSLAITGGDFRRRSCGRAARWSLCEQSG